MNREYVLAFLLLSSVCSFTLVSQMRVTYASEFRIIDLFTQKAPYNGKGLNQSSDAFAPHEEVIVYAYVTYRDAPVANNLVAFEILGPMNPINNITFSRTAITNSSGIATLDFRIPWPIENPETIIFGTWKVCARTNIAEVQAEDTLTFKVGWIVEILSMATVDDDFQPQTVFGKGNCVGVELVLRNIAMLSRMATLAIAAYDKMNVPFGNIEIDSFEIKPGEVYVYIFCKLKIPGWITVGDAMVNASAYTAPLGTGGVPYCPEVSTIFSITARDVAIISVLPSATSIVAGEVVNVSVVVRNEGSATETFEVSAYCDSILIGTSSVVSLSPNAQRDLVFVWTTSGLPDGTYTLKASTNVLPGEIDIGDNTYIDGSVVIGARPVYAAPRGLIIMALIAAVAIAMALIALLLSRNKKA